mmetsp:Transcript_19174/g.54436  ORF Transcript_19174/g.54436 Transcript_19174/m.54436 type:complete len:164 (+) Transcript_19174:115-606(+)|eukprot:CAMPEP_0119553470 /NCGR_PEP_ID=MMETSP1352-20130426/6220_1 /TAXON_ID=265584 /ORGANISM="Stauroneis constricta, Strain CCMP1120" /LENGTH=163 /DNA_ID=CAMNT_0007599893 /DNA_START=116 /DNA_END=607 /DNA_ORIENTATION=-
MTDEQEQQQTTTIADPSILLSKRTIYVGGLNNNNNSNANNNITQSLLRATFIPFGNIQTIDIPMDYEKGTTRGFAFIEYYDIDDATEAIYNMDGFELNGSTLRVSVAQVNQIHKLMGGSGKNGAIWDNDEWFQQNVAAGGDGSGGADAETKENDEDVLKDGKP